MSAAEAVQVEAPGDRFLPLLDSKNDGKLLRALDGAVHAIARKMQEVAADDEYVTVTGQLNLKMVFAYHADGEIGVEVCFGEPKVTRTLPFKEENYGRYCVDSQGNFVLLGGDDDEQGLLDF